MTAFHARANGASKGGCGHSAVTGAKKKGSPFAKPLDAVVLPGGISKRLRALWLPDARQLTHILRHTFASHYMMGGGDILSLQRILGHSSITMTMRYAHLSPDHLESALRLSPLAQSRHVAI